MGAQDSIKDPMDTTKFCMPPFNIKEEVKKELFNCFVRANFKELIIFCQPNLEIVIFTDSTNAYRVPATNYKTIEVINSLIEKINYTYFEMGSYETAHQEFVYLVRVDYKYFFFFYLEPGGSIKKIVFKWTK